MQQFKEALKTLEKSRQFQEWKKKNPEAYLSYAMLVLEDKDDGWKIGYYHKKTNKITSFVIGDEIKVEPEDDILQKEEKAVERVDAEKVNHDLSDAITVAYELQQEEFATESPKKIIAVLQTLDNAQVWNITFLTQSYNTLNFKIKSDNLKVIEKKLSPLFQFQK